MQPWPDQNSVCSLGCPQTQRSTFCKVLLYVFCSSLTMEVDLYRKEAIIPPATFAKLSVLASFLEGFWLSLHKPDFLVDDSLIIQNILRTGWNQRKLVCRKRGGPHLPWELMQHRGLLKSEYLRCHKSGSLCVSMDKAGGLGFCFVLLLFKFFNF